MLGQMIPANQHHPGAVVLKYLLAVLRIILILLKSIDYQVPLPGLQLSKYGVKIFLKSYQAIPIFSLA